MPTIISPRATWKMLRAGNVRGGLRVLRDGQAAVRLHVVAAALRTGILDALAEERAPTSALAERIRAVDDSLLEPFLRVLQAAGLIAARSDGGWELTRAGCTLVRDDLVRAGYEVMAGPHTAPYRELGQLLDGGSRRRDVVEQAELIARSSAGFEPFVRGVLTRCITRRRPRRVLDVGCGAGGELAMMLEAAPAAAGVGVDTDARAVALAERTLADRGLRGRGQVVHADIRRIATDDGTGILAEPFDLALLANVVYYVPVDERATLLRAVADLLGPGGVLLVVTTVASPDFFSRHFDLLLRAQEGGMALPEQDELLGQLVEAGLRPDAPQRIAPGTPLVAVTATVPGS